jgi:hypothetical protein
MGGMAGPAAGTGAGVGAKERCGGVWVQSCKQQTQQPQRITVHNVWHCLAHGKGHGGVRDPAGASRATGGRYDQRQKGVRQLQRGLA